MARGTAAHLDPCETQNFIFFEDDDDEDYFSDIDDEDDDGDDLQNTFLVDLPSFDDVGSFQDFDFDKLCNPDNPEIGNTSAEDINEETSGERIKIIAGVVGLVVIFVILLIVFVFAVKRICKKSPRKEINPYLGTAGSYKKIECDYAWFLLLILSLLECTYQPFFWDFN